MDSKTAIKVSAAFSNRVGASLNPKHASGAGLLFRFEKLSHPSTGKTKREQYLCVSISRPV